MTVVTIKDAIISNSPPSDTTRQRAHIRVPHGKDSLIGSKKRELTKSKLAKALPRLNSAGSDSSRAEKRSNMVIKGPPRNSRLFANKFTTRLLKS